MVIFLSTGYIERRVNFSFFIHLSDLLLGENHKSIFLRETFFACLGVGEGGYTRMLLKC